MKRLGQAHEIAEVAAFLCSDRGVVRDRRRRSGRRRPQHPHSVTMTGARYVGARVQRVEDARLLTGGGSYVDDVVLPGMLHARFVRSPFARAAIRGIDASEALAMPGVRFVFTAADLNPDAKEQWHTSIGATGSRDAASAARGGRGALRRRSGRARGRRHARDRARRGRARGRRLRAAGRRSSTTRRQRRATASSTKRTAPMSSASSPDSRGPRCRTRSTTPRTS